MLKINIICVGSIKDKYIKEGISEFSKRINKFANIFFVELKESTKDNIRALSEEKEKIISQMKKGYNIALALKGHNFSSIEFANFISKSQQNHSQINFIIGSSHGLHQDVLNRADFKMSFSQLTFPHQLFRLILIEQIYRGLSINHNGKYHK